MKKLSALVVPLAFAVVSLAPAGASAQDCDVSITVDHGCIAESNGWAALGDVTGATNPISILWSTGETVQFIHGLPSGDHWVMVTDAEGCWDKVEFTVDCEKECEVEVMVEWGCIAESNGWAAVEGVTGATNPISILWSTGETTQFISGLPSGDHWVMVTDAEGCWDKEEFSVDCEKDEEPCELRTQTQGGWGAPAAGNNPGVYRDQHFAAAFPEGLVIGCTNTLTLTTAQAVRNFLPSGGPPQQLNSSMVNPNNYGNVLAGQLVALTLSVGFDVHDPDFGTGGLLADAVINNGTFAGWTVQQLLDEANDFIGGCGSSYSASQLNGGLSMVNENFVDGTTNNGNLDCAPIGGTRMLMVEEGSLATQLYPVPANDVLNIDLLSTANSVLEIQLMDATGRIVMVHGNEAFQAGEQRTIRLNVGQLNNGTYLVAMIRNGELMRTERVIIAR